MCVTSSPVNEHPNVAFVAIENIDAAAMMLVLKMQSHETRQVARQTSVSCHQYELTNQCSYLSMQWGEATAGAPHFLSAALPIEVAPRRSPAVRIQLDQAGCGGFQPLVTGRSQCEEGCFQQIALNSAACRETTRTVADTTVSSPPAWCWHPSPASITYIHHHALFHVAEQTIDLEAQCSFSNRNEQVITMRPTVWVLCIVKTGHATCFGVICWQMPLAGKKAICEHHIYRHFVSPRYCATFQVCGQVSFKSDSWTCVNLRCSSPRGDPQTQAQQ